MRCDWLISRRTALKGLGAAVSLPLLEQLGWADAAAAAAASAGVPTPDHIVIVVEENRAAGQIIGSASAPYINSLVAQGANFTQSFAITHPSQPNYLALFSGSTQGITDDAVPPNFTTANLGAALLAKGRTFVGYSESLPAVGSTVATTTTGFARKHAPWVNWQGSTTNGLPAATNQPLTAFPTDFSTLPTVSFVIPNLFNDMHDGTVAAGDTWLRQHLDAYVQWAKTHNSLLILTWDEDDHSAGNQIATVIVGARVQVGTYAERIDHYRLLRTIEDMYGLAHSGAAATAAPITSCWTPAPVIGTGTGLSGAYFDNQDLTGAAVLRTDAAIDFTWASTVSPVAGIAAATYSVRWAGRVQAQYSQTYTFFVTADDGVRLWVNGRLLVDHWLDQGPTEYSGTIALTAGTTYDIVIEYYQAGGGARIALAWSSASTSKQIIPTRQLYPAGVAAPWAAQDLGSGTLAGSGYVTGDTVVLSGAGGDIFKAADAGRLFTQPLSGDGTIVTRVVSLTNTNPWAKAGVMIREGTAAGAKHAFCFITPGNGVGFIRRTATNGMSTYTAGSKSAVPRWLKLVRAGSTITALESADGTTWMVVGTVSVSLVNPVQIGFAVTSGDNSRLCTAVFDLVQITPSAAA